MSDHKPVDQFLLERYVAGECSPREQHLVDGWLAADAGRQALVDEARAIWERSARPLEEFDSRRAWESVRRQLRAGSSRLRIASAGRRVSEQRVATRIGAVAAAAVLVLGLGYAIGADTHHGQVSVSVTGREYATAPGQRETVTLGDGTKFTLAPASRLRLAGDFGHAAREVYLEGEANFAVAHDASRPFVVNASGAIVRDIGTQFDVRRYPGEPIVRVVVAEGMVALAAGGARRYRPLRAGDLAIVADTTVAVTHDADVAALTGWSHGELTFRNRPLGEVVVDLSRWFGVDVQLADPGLARRLVTATVTDEPVGAAMDVLAPAFGTIWERRGTTIVLRPLSR